MPENISLAERKQQTFLLLKETLPQARMIPDERIRAWIDRVCEVEADRLEWHALRARGIGGSESGPLVTGFRGEYDFNSPRDIIAGKLLMDAPDGGSGDTRRGIALEPVARQLLMEKHPFRQRPDIVAAMADVLDLEHPWLVGNPDDILELIPTGQLFVTDYKVPRPDTLEACRKVGGVKFDYVVQLHHMKKLADHALEMMGDSKRIEGLILTSLDTNNWDVDVQEVSYDPALDNEIMSVCDMYWNDFVLKGELPPPPDRKVLSNDEIPVATQEDLKQAAAEFLATKSLAAELTKHANLRADAVTRITEEFRLADKSIKFMGVTVKAVSAMDKVKVALLCIRNSLDVPKDDAPEPEWIAAIDNLRQLGEDVAPCFEETHRVSVSMAKSGAAAEIVSTFKLEAAVRADHLMQKIQGQAASPSQVQEASPPKTRTPRRGPVSV